MTHRHTAQGKKPDTNEYILCNPFRLEEVQNRLEVRGAIILGRQPETGRGARGPRGALVLF